MSNVKPFIPKDNQALPDSYKLTVWYVTGKSEEFDLASHRYSKETGMIEIWTTDDLCSWIPISSVQRLQFDKNFSKMIAIKAEMEAKNA